MVHFRLTIVALIIGVLQVCTANPISTEEEFDVAKLFSADELERAKNVGLPLRQLFEGILDEGLTFDEMIKIHQLRTSPELPKNAYPGCKILVPELKMAANFTSTHEANIPKILVNAERLEEHDVMRFARVTVCMYFGEPDVFDMKANSFGLPLVPYMEMRFMTMKAEKAKGTDRVKVVKQMCCLNKHRDEAVRLDKSTFTGLPDGDMNEFTEHWNQYEIADTLKSFENICEFLDTKDQTNDECMVAIPIPNDADHE